MKDETQDREARRRLRLAATIGDAIDALVAIECPHCNSYIETPSIEDIQEWLEEHE